ncbi:MAG: hypothetical protein ACI4VL_06670 [Bacilli bacterium]
MTYLSIIEKLRILLDMLLDFKFILIFVILLLILTFLYAIRRISGKKYALMMLSTFIMLFAISIISNYKVLANTFDNFTTIFFGNIYFPSIYVYIGVLVICFITFITSILNTMLKKIYKIINSIMFVCNNILLIIVLNIIAKNKIDIFSVSSLYTNNNLVAILEISMNLFILWVLSLIIVYTTNCICDRIMVKKRVVVDSNVSNTLEVFNDINEDINVNNDIFNEVDTQTMNDTNLDNINSINKEASITIDVTPDTLVVRDIKEEHGTTFEDILNGNIEVVYYQNDNTCNDLEYSIVNPQEIYENKYNYQIENKSKNDTSFQDIVKNIEDNTIKEQDKSFEKKKLVEDRLIINTVSLDDLNKEDNIVELIKDNEDNIKEDIISHSDNEYTIDDYKKISKMLKALKIHASDSNISVDDAVTISLISNYSIDDCVKFKEILESNLN